MKRVMLYFGSFNPIHKGHIALAEYAVEKGLCDELVLVVSPQSPYKQAEELAPEMDRFEMAEAACAAARATSSAATPLADSEAAVRSDVATKLLCSTLSRICSSVMVSSAMEYLFLDSPS